MLYTIVYLGCLSDNTCLARRHRRRQEHDDLSPPRLSLRSTDFSCSHTSVSNTSDPEPRSRKSYHRQKRRKTNRTARHFLSISPCHSSNDQKQKSIRVRSWQRSSMPHILPLVLILARLIGVIPTLATSVLIGEDQCVAQTSRKC
jgi:hypothetical protein